MKTLTDFALKKECNLLQSVGDKLDKIDSLIDWKSFRIIFEFIYFNKRVSLGRHEAEIIIMFKMLFYSNCMIFPILNLRNNVLNQISFRNFLVFLSKY
jgi:hypothetical protein